MPNQHLITLQTQNGITIHGYLICPEHEDRDAVDAIAGKIQDIANDIGASYLPFILSTKLDTGAVTVRNVMRRNGAAKALKLASRTLHGKDQHHFSIFALRTSCDDNQTLMNLH